MDSIENTEGTIEPEQTEKKSKFTFALAEDILGAFFVALLTVLPLVLKFFKKFKITVLNADSAVMQIVFIFACIAGAVTWRGKSHVSLASLTDNIHGKFKTVIECIREAVVPCVLVSLFFASFCEAFAAFAPGEKIWGVPLPLIFAALPLAYLSMIIRGVIHSEHRISCIAGLVLGCIISTGSFAGVLYYIFHLENLDFLYSINNIWILITQKTMALLIVIMVIFAILGVPLFVVIGAVSYIAFSQGGGYVDVIPLEAYNILTDKSIAAIPLFTVAGYILSMGSAGSRLVDVFKSLFGWFRGGVVIASVLVVTFFTTFTGVSGVTILALGSLLTAALCGSGYKEGDAQSLITSSGALGLLFPPSVAIIMYGTINYFTVDVFDIFKGAVIPGALLAISMIVLGIIKDKPVERPAFSFKAIFESFKNGIFELLMPVFIMVFYFTGIFTLLETSAFAVLYAYIMETFVRRDFSLKKSFEVVAQSIPITGGVLFILASARGLSSYLVDAQVPVLFTEFVNQYIHSKYLFLLLMNVFLIIAGCLMDIYSAILIISPLLMPVAASFGIPPVHTSVVFLMNMQLGFLTPPVGMDLFIASYTFKTPLMKIVKDILPFLLVQAVILLLVTYVPWFTSF